MAQLRKGRDVRHLRKPLHGAWLGSLLDFLLLRQAEQARPQRSLHSRSYLHSSKQSLKFVGHVQSVFGYWVEETGGSWWQSGRGKLFARKKAEKSQQQQSLKKEKTEWVRIRFNSQMGSGKGICYFKEKAALKYRNTYGPLSRAWEKENMLLVHFSWGEQQNLGACKEYS